MPWHTTKLWQAALAFTALLFLLLLLIWIPVSVAGAHQRAPGLAASATVTMPQATPTTDATVTTLNKEKLTQEIDQLQHQNDHSLSAWLWNTASTTISTLAVVLTALFGVFRWWFGDRRAEREKRAEERFQSVVEGLGSKDIEPRVGAAIMLRTFLRPGYKQFYRQVFDLAVAHLRLRKPDLEPVRDSISKQW